MRNAYLTATLLLILLIALFLTSGFLYHTHPAWPWVKAFAEAGMVGALADWFAVVALFRYPLGIPLPHTAIIPNRKNHIAKNISTFVTENFLNSTQITTRIAALDPAVRIATWLSHTPNAQNLANKIRSFLLPLTSSLADPTFTALIAGNIRNFLTKANPAPTLGNLIKTITDQKREQQILTSGLEMLSKWIASNHTLIEQKISTELTRVPDLLGLKQVLVQNLATKIIHHIQGSLTEISNNPEHTVRQQFHEKILTLSHDLIHSPDWQEKVNHWKNETLESPKFNDWIQQLTLGIRQSLENDLSNETNSHIQKHLSITLEHAAQKLQNDAELRAKLNFTLINAVKKFTENHGHELRNIIEEKIHTWDGKELAARLEQQVGNDLQYIRINGTLIGGIIGLLIHTTSHYLFP